MGLRSKPPWRHGGHGVVDIVGPVAPSGRASGRGDSQECTQIGQNGPSAPFWGICVHCWAVALDVDRRGDSQECTQIGGNGLSAPFWGICVHCWAVGLGCGWPWDRNSVHKWEDRASWRRFGAFVYTVATRVAIRIATRAAPVATSASTTMACRRPLLAGPSRLVGKTDSERVAPLPGWHLRRGRQPTRTPEEPDVAPHSEKRSSKMMPRQVECTVTRRGSRGPEQS